MSAKDQFDDVLRRMLARPPDKPKAKKPSAKKPKRTKKKPA